MILRLGIVLVLLSGCVRTDDARSAEQPIHAGPSHRLVTLQLSPTGLTVLNRVEVASPLPTLRVPEQLPWHVVLRDSKNAVLYQVDLPPADELRGEFQSNGQAIDPHHSRLATAVFSVRLPSAAGTLTLSTDSETLGTVELP